jgi:hypothetical protein
MMVLQLQSVDADFLSWHAAVACGGCVPGGCSAV